MLVYSTSRFYYRSRIVVFLDKPVGITLEPPLFFNSTVARVLHTVKTVSALLAHVTAVCASGNGPSVGLQLYPSP